MIFRKLIDRGAIFHGGKLSDSSLGNIDLLDEFGNFRESVSTWDVGVFIEHDKYWVILQDAIDYRLVVVDRDTGEIVEVGEENAVVRYKNNKEELMKIIQVIGDGKEVEACFLKNSKSLYERRFIKARIDCLEVLIKPLGVWASLDEVSELGWFSENHIKESKIGTGNFDASGVKYNRRKTDNKNNCKVGVSA
jgi:hypothetical protein